MNTIRLHDEHLKVIAKSLEVYYRLRSGQINMALDLAYPCPLPWDFAQAVEKLIRCYTHPELCNSSSYGFNSEKIDDAKVAYEIFKTFQEFLSVSSNGGFYGHTVNYHGPLKSSEVPYPEIVNFFKYKDYNLPDDESNNKAYDLYKKEKYEDLWNFVDSLNLDLPKGEKKELIPSENKIFVRVHRPQRKEENI